MKVALSIKAGFTGFLGGALTWFLGWVIYDELELWKTMSSQNFQNRLVVCCLTFFAFSFVAVYAKFRPKKILETEKVDPLEGLEEIPEAEIEPFSRVEEWKIEEYEKPIVI